MEKRTLSSCAYCKANGSASWDYNLSSWQSDKFHCCRKFYHIFSSEQFIWKRCEQAELSNTVMTLAQETEIIWFPWTWSISLWKIYLPQLPPRVPEFQDQIIQQNRISLWKKKKFCHSCLSSVWTVQNWIYDKIFYNNEICHSAHKVGCWRINS